MHDIVSKSQDILSKLHVDWQSQTNTILERNSHMLNNQLMSDITLTCGACATAKDSSISQQCCFHAHKYVLATSSPVFFAMFFGDLAETDSVIHLPDVDHETLAEFLRFLYTEDCTLTPETAVVIMYLAKKYIVPSLVTKCVDVIAECMNCENVLTILEQMILFDELEMQDKCWGMIDRDTLSILSSDAFTELSRPTLLRLLTRGRKLSVSPVETFHAVLFWAEKQCLTLGVKGSGENKRAMLGDDVVNQLRFQDMTLDELAQYVSTSGILTDEEFESRWQEVNTPDDKALDTEHLGLISSNDHYCISRFSPEDIKAPTTAWSYGSRPDRISFSTSLPAVLHGVHLFGDDTGSKYEVALEVSGVRVDGTFTSQLDTKRGVYGFDVMLYPPLALSKDTAVTVEAYIRGPNSYYGNDGEALVDIGGATVVFRDTPGASNGTGVRQGQFDYIMMSFLS